MTRPFLTERLLMGRKESNQTNKQIRRGLSSDIWFGFMGPLSCPLKHNFHRWSLNFQFLMVILILFHYDAPTVYGLCLHKATRQPMQSNNTQ